MTIADRTVVLLILDGWGYRTEPQDNAIAAASLPTWNALWSAYPHGLLTGSGVAVGLPVGQMGNSEVGHLNMGAGRLVPQELLRINQAIADQSFFSNPILVQALEQACMQQTALHIMGLLSDGGVHSHELHLHALLEMASRTSVKAVYLHVFLDGRDTAPQQAQASLTLLEQQCQRLACGRIVSVVGRYYAMDRDNRWERIAQAYDLLTTGHAPFQASSASAALQQAYARGETDEFVQATVICPDAATPVSMQAGDVVVFMNFRADRARSLTRAFVQAEFHAFTRRCHPALGKFVCLTEYADDLPAAVAFAPQRVRNNLGEYVAACGLRQLRIAETEKYAHVTFFFNGGIEAPYSGEERILIPSPAVATYDLQPQMSAEALTDTLIAAIASRQYGLIVCNYANADMVGHTGNFAATVAAVETIDACLARIVAALALVGAELLITADHGNAEQMFDLHNAQPHTAHTTNPVPFLYVGQRVLSCMANGSLVDVAPTVLYLLGLPQPEQMTGTALLQDIKSESSTQ